MRQAWSTTQWNDMLPAFWGSTGSRDAPAPNTIGNIQPIGMYQCGQGTLSDTDTNRCYRQGMQYTEISVTFTTPMILHSVEIRPDSIRPFDFRVDVEDDGGRNGNRLEVAPNLIDGSGTLTVNSDGTRLGDAYFSTIVFRDGNDASTVQGYDARYFSTATFDDDANWGIICYRQQRGDMVIGWVRCLTIGNMQTELLTTGTCGANPEREEMAADIPMAFSQSATSVIKDRGRVTCLAGAIFLNSVRALNWDGNVASSDFLKQGNVGRSVETSSQATVVDEPKVCSLKFQSSKHYAKANWYDYDGTELGTACTDDQPCVCLKVGSPATQVFGTGTSWWPAKQNSPPNESGSTASITGIPVIDTKEISRIGVATFDSVHAISCYSSGMLANGDIIGAGKTTGACKVVLRTRGLLDSTAEEVIFVDETDWVGHDPPITQHRTSSIQVVTLNSEFAIACAQAYPDSVHITTSVFGSCSVLKREGTALTRVALLKFTHKLRLTYSIVAMDATTALLCDAPIDSVTLSVAGVTRPGISAPLNSYNNMPGMQCIVLTRGDSTLTSSTPVGIPLLRTGEAGEYNDAGDSMFTFKQVSKLSALVKLDATHAILCYQEEYGGNTGGYCSMGCDDEMQGHCVPLTIDSSGTVISGAPVVYNELLTRNPRLVRMSSKTAVVCYHNIGLKKIPEHSSACALLKWVSGDGSTMKIVAGKSLKIYTPKNTETHQIDPDASNFVVPIKVGDNVMVTYK